MLKLDKLMHVVIQIEQVGSLMQRFMFEVKMFRKLKIKDEMNFILPDKNE